MKEGYEPQPLQPGFELHHERNGMTEHQDAPRKHEPHAIHDDHAKGPHDPKEINPKIASDIAYWCGQLGVTGDQLHEAIRSHGTHVEKIRAALHKAT
jgi:uncharacterized protein DUF3606